MAVDPTTTAPAAGNAMQPRSRRNAHALIAIALVTFSALAWLAVATLVALWPYKLRIAAAVLVLETAFHFLVWRPRYHKFNVAPELHEPADFDADQLFARFMRFVNELPQGVDFQGYLRGWFLGARWEDIKRDNVVEFMAYGFWYRTL